ncbi:hypothetical protein N0V90_007076 [Kalmusia sp. IMI 367209]|nr:hypothetical protein N0V90_007076 [Kalmusia sp. IMI 367209]
MKPRVNGTTTRNHPFIETVETKNRKRSRSMSSVARLSQDDPTAAVSTKRPRAAKKLKLQTTSATMDEKSTSASETNTSIDSKQAKADSRKANIAAARTDKEGKADDERKWKQAWKEWISDPEDINMAKFERTYSKDPVNVKESDKIYGVKREELDCLQHCPAPNPHGRGFTPMKLLKTIEVQYLAFRKEAMLAGVPQDDEKDLLEQGKKSTRRRMSSWTYLREVEEVLLLNKASYAPWRGCEA